jgi:hypothetical protein
LDSKPSALLDRGRAIKILVVLFMLLVLIGGASMVMYVCYRLIRLAVRKGTEDAWRRRER